MHKKLVVANTLHVAESIGSFQFSIYSTSRNLAYIACLLQSFIQKTG